MTSHEIYEKVRSLSDGEKYKLLTQHFKPSAFPKTYQVSNIHLPQVPQPH